MTTGNDLNDWDGYCPDGQPYGYFRRRIWSGADSAPGVFDKENGYTATVYERKMSRIRYQLIAGFPWYYDSSHALFCPSLPAVTDFPVNEATAKVWDQLTQSKFNAGVASGEFRETVRMLSSMVRSLAKAVRYARQGRFDAALHSLAGARRGSSAFSVFGNTWLQFTYGLIPFLKDMQALYDYLVRDYEVVSRVKVAVVRKLGGSKSQNGVRWNYEGKSICAIRGEVRSTLGEADRLGLADPASIAWELTRLSFVVDWAFPIGNFLAAANAARATSGSNFWITKCNMETLSAPRNENVTSYLFGTDQSCFSSYTTVFRSQLVALPWDFPTIQNPFGDSYSRYISSAALLRQSFH